MSQLYGFFAAVAFFTRVPCPGWVDYGSDSQRLAAGYAPLVGYFIGALGAATYWLAAAVFPPEIAVIAALIAVLLVTGGLHEDGFADCCDGFGSGASRERTLEIMHDPRCGSFAVVGLVMLILSKAAILLAIVQASAQISDHSFSLLALIFICAHALSRTLAVAFIFTHRYVSAGQRAGAMTDPMSRSVFLLSVGLGIVPLAGFAALGHARLALAALPLIPLAWVLGVYFRRRLGGYNGDCLGAAQQLTEVSFYLAVYVLMRP